VSTFGHLHQLPAMWIKYAETCIVASLLTSLRYASKLLGLHRASRIGEFVSDLYVAMLH
jgi:hypothetical protein